MTLPGVEKAWGESRDFIVSQMARDLGKLGTLEPHDPVLSSLADLLDDQGVIDLYMDLLNMSGREDIEWVDEFLYYFPFFDDILPVD